MNSNLAIDLVPLAKELDDSKVTPGVLGFVVFALLGLAVWFLLKSMNRHMHKVVFDESKTAETPDKADPGADGAGPGAGPDADKDTGAAAGAKNGGGTKR